MEGQRVALIVDNPARDLGGLVLLATHLCARGATCFLVPFNLAHAELGALAPDFVLLNYLRVTNEPLAHHLLDAGVQLGVLDTEGGVLLDFADYETGRMTPDADLRQRIACFCSWGHRLASHAQAAGWYRAEQIFVTGSPRFDFYAPPWRAAALATTATTPSPDAPLILVNGSFSLANPRFYTPDAEIENWVRNGYKRAHVRQLQQTQRQTLEQLAALTNRIAAAFPGATVVYRPHPFERLDTYTGLLEPRDNLHLVREGTVDGWILRARALVQRSCSTAIEAGMAGVIALSPQWIPTALPIETIDAISVICETEAALMAQLEAALQAPPAIPEPVAARLAQITTDWFCAIDGRAHERVAEAIAQSAHRDGQGISLDACKRLFHGHYHRGPASKRAAGWLRARLGLPATWSFRQRRDLGGTHWDRSGKQFGVDEVQRLAEALDACRIASDQEPVAATVGRASDLGDYHLPYTGGRTIALHPRSQ